jgi:membrane fusion protein, multidrug efflux system
MSRSRALGVTLAVLVLAGVGSYALRKADGDGTGPGHADSGQRGGYRQQRGFDRNRAIPVRVVTTRRGDLDLWVDALGTVTAANTVTVKSRVDGQLVRVALKEGQRVKAGDLLAQVDPRPFQVALDQAQGQLARDQAQLASAQVELKRYRGLLKEDSIASQQVDTQKAQVGQMEGTVQADRAQVANARLQLDFSHITAPIGGRLGLRLVDVGNMVHAGDAGGLVVITQTQPIYAVFSVPADGIAELVRRWHRGERLEVRAYDRDGKTLLATGHLSSIDNQIDTTTGTVKLKAEFANQDEALFPNQFVNVRLKTATLSGAVLAPTAAVQQGTAGTFVYLVKGDSTVTLRQVTLGPSAGDTVAVADGLAPGDRLVIDGADKLREGSKVEIAEAGPAAARGKRGRSPPAAPETTAEPTSTAGAPTRGRHWPHRNGSHPDQAPTRP